jgi:hypothetical protein
VSGDFGGGGDVSGGDVSGKKDNAELEAAAEKAAAEIAAAQMAAAQMAEAQRAEAERAEAERAEAQRAEAQRAEEESGSPPPAEASANDPNDKTKTGEPQAAADQTPNAPKLAPAGKANALPTDVGLPKATGLTARDPKLSPAGKAHAPPGAGPPQAATGPKLSPASKANPPTGAGRPQAARGQATGSPKLAPAGNANPPTGTGTAQPTTPTPSAKPTNLTPGAQPAVPETPTRVGQTTTERPTPERPGAPDPTADDLHLARLSHPKEPPQPGPDLRAESRPSFDPAAALRNAQHEINDAARSQQVDPSRTLHKAREQWLRDATPDPLADTITKRTKTAAGQSDSPATKEPRKPPSPKAQPDAAVQQTAPTNLHRVAGTPPAPLPAEGAPGPRAGMHDKKPEDQHPSGSESHADHPSDAPLNNPFIAAGATLAGALANSLAAAVSFTGQPGDNAGQSDFQLVADGTDLGEGQPGFEDGVTDPRLGQIATVEQFAKSAPLQSVRTEIAEANERRSMSSSPADDLALPILEAILRLREAQNPNDWAKNRANEVQIGDPAHTGSNLPGLAARLYSDGGSLDALNELSLELWRDATGDNRLLGRAMYKVLDADIARIKMEVAKDWTEHAKAISYDSLIAERTEIADRLAGGDRYFDAYDDKMRLSIHDAEIGSRISQAVDRWAEQTPLEQQALQVQVLAAVAARSPSMEAALTAVAVGQAFENSVRAVAERMAASLSMIELSERIQRLNDKAPSDPTGVTTAAASALYRILQARVEHEAEADVRGLSVEQIESLATQIRQVDWSDRTPLQEAYLDLYIEVLSDLNNLVWDREGQMKTKAQMLRDQRIAGNDAALEALTGNIASSFVMWATDDPRWAAIAGGAFDIAGAVAEAHNVNAALGADIERAARPAVVDQLESNVGRIILPEALRLSDGPITEGGSAGLKLSGSQQRPGWTREEIDRFAEHMPKFVDGRAEISAYLRDLDGASGNEAHGGGVADRTLGEYPAYLVRMGYADKPSEFGVAIFDGPRGLEDATKFARDWHRYLVERGVELERSSLAVPSVWKNKDGSPGGISTLSHVQIVEITQNATEEGQPRGVAYLHGPIAPQPEGGTRWWPEDRTITTLPGGGMQVMIDPKTKQGGQLRVIETLALPVTGNPQRTQSGEIGR